MKKWLVVLAVLAGLIFSGCVGENEMDFTPVKRTSSSYDKDTPQLDVADGKVYFVWGEKDVSNRYQIWTAIMDIDGSNFIATKRTTSAYSKYQPQLQVVGTKIYYMWKELDGSSDYQIWIASMDTDGSNWSETKKTNTTPYKRGPRLQVVGTKIYYVWSERTDGGAHSIWTASMDTDGSNWSATERQSITTDSSLIWIVRQYVLGTKIYYVWRDKNTNYELWTASMDIDGSNWSASQRRTSSKRIRWVTLAVFGNTIYYAWYEQDASNISQIWTGTMNISGSAWTATKRTDSADWGLLDIELEVYDDVIYYACSRYKVAGDYEQQIWTAQMNIDGSEWEITQRTTIVDTYKELVQQKIGSDIHFVWREYDGSDWQIWTALIGLIDKEAPWKEDVIKPTGEVKVETPRRSGNWVTLEDVMRIHTSSGKDMSSPCNPIEIGQAEVIVSNISKNFNSFEEASEWYRNLEGNALQIKLGY